MNKYSVFARHPQTSFIQRLTEEVGDSLRLINPWEGESLPREGIAILRPSSRYRDSDEWTCFQNVSPHLRIINSPSAFAKFRTKDLQYLFWDSQGISVLPWLPLAGLNQKKALSFLHQLGKEGIIKPTLGLQGWGVRSICPESFKQWWEDKVIEGDLDYLIQRQALGEEYRVFFIGEKRWVLKRQGVAGEAANYARGGSATLTTLPTRHRDLVEKIISLSNAHYGAVDFIEEGGSLWPLDLNLAPGIEQLESVSGQNIMRELLLSLNSAT